jgi:hypothetical protein
MAAGPRSPTKLFSERLIASAAQRIGSSGGERGAPGEGEEIFDRHAGRRRETAEARDSLSGRAISTVQRLASLFRS